VELFTDVGGSGKNFKNTILDDEARYPIGTEVSKIPAPFSRAYQPEGNLSDFDGLCAKGTWQLKVTDDDGVLTGILQSWSLIIEVEPPPTADFAGNPTSGCAPLTVQFTDKSIENITNWSWDFGDGGTSTQQSPSHTYNDPGVYTVSLTVTGPCGSNTKTRPDYITVIPPPTAAFEGDPTSGRAPLTVEFTDKSEGNINSCSWDFGDGGTSTQQSQSHTYNDPGVYTVSLTVTGPCGSDTETRPDYINVKPPLPACITLGLITSLGVEVDPCDPNTLLTVLSINDNDVKCLILGTTTADFEKHADHPAADADNFDLTTYASLDDANVVQTVFEEPVTTIFILERGADDSGFFQPIDVNGIPICGMLPFTKADFQFDPNLKIVDQTAGAIAIEAKDPIYGLQILPPVDKPLGIDPASISAIRAVLAPSFVVMVSTSSDDAEEHVLDGTMDSLTSSDLELGYEDSFAPENLQTIGCRWTGVPIPQGATITEAWVQFSADSVGSSYHIFDVSVIIEGELSANPATFSSTAGNISSRPTTTASVVWDIPRWMTTHAMGPEERTPDISSIIQEIVNQNGWAGSAIVLMFRDNPAKPSAGTREAEAYDGEAAEAPLLHISYQ